MAASPPIPQTAVTFGYPNSLVGETDHWLVLTRPKQVTLGSLVLACRQPATAFGSIDPAAFADLAAAVPQIERMLEQFCAYEKINYLMLMMVDPDVHFHVIPRYSEPRTRDTHVYPDSGWPGPPALGEAIPLDGPALLSMTEALKDIWNAESGQSAS